MYTYIYIDIYIYTYIYIYVCVQFFGLAYQHSRFPTVQSVRITSSLQGQWRPAMATGRLFGPSRCLGVTDTDASDASHKSWRPGEVTLQMANNG